MAQTHQNLILSRLSKTDLALLEPHLEPVDLPLRKILGRANKKITAVYFPESGFASVVVNTGKPIEVGLIGREGMTGLAVVFGGDRDDNETYMQAAGQGQCMRANASAQRYREEQNSAQLLLRYRPCLPQSDDEDRRCQRSFKDRGTLGALAANGPRPCGIAGATPHTRVLGDDARRSATRRNCGSSTPRTRWRDRQTTRSHRHLQSGGAEKVVEWNLFASG